LEVFHLADFFKLNKNKYYKPLNDIKKISLSNKQTEICGFLIQIGKGKGIVAVECENINIDKKLNFEISPKDFINANKKGEVLAVFHSHPSSDCSPSKIDKSLCNETLIPFLIFSIKDGKFSLTYPSEYYVKNNLLDELEQYIKMCNLSIEE